MPMMNNFSPGFPPQAGNIPTPFQNFGNHTVTAPNGWMPGSAMPGMPVEEGGMMHQTGPMRRGGGRFNQRPGPYDRRNQNQNFNPNPRFVGVSGRLTPPRNGMPAGRMMMMMGGGAGKWGDGAGAQTVGPREAVQGRQLKSYEDLDAVGGSGSDGCEHHSPCTSQPIGIQQKTRRLKSQRKISNEQQTPYQKRPHEAHANRSLARLDLLTNHTYSFRHLGTQTPSFSFESAQHSRPEQHSLPPSWQGSNCFEQRTWTPLPPWRARSPE
ncbi:MAG: hypothetical protein L6R42_002559 [Xanthoria sp. 1 TBL-2021]|nr:MAG: hypothetical protein L6R42_002559 [Xanthoria sp. 1 TBL-2021]